MTYCNFSLARLGLPFCPFEPGFVLVRRRWGALIDSMRYPRPPPERKFLTSRKGTPGMPHCLLLNHDLLLLRIYTALRILRCDGDHALAGRQGRGKVVKTAICGHNRDFPSIH